VQTTQKSQVTAGSLSSANARSSLYNNLTMLQRTNLESPNKVNQHIAVSKQTITYRLY